MKLALFLSLLRHLLSLPVSPYDRDETPQDRQDRLSVVALAIVDAANGDRGKVAYLATQARNESAFRRDVQECQCPKYQCDMGRDGKARANGLWQLHRVPSLPVSTWDGYCGLTYEAVRTSADRALWPYDARHLAASFARHGGIGATARDKWAQDRAAESRKLEARL